MRLNAYSIKSPSYFLGLVVCVAIVLVAGSLRAQNPSQAQDRAQLLRAQTNPTYGPEPSAEDQGYAAVSPNDKDLGEQQILKRQEEYKPFTFSFAVPFFYTSNVALTSSGVEDDVLVAPALAFTYQPRITGTLYGEISLVQQFFFYDRFPDLNFTSFDAVAGLTYYLPQFHNLSLRARYDFNRLTDDDFYPFFNNNSFILNAELPFRFGRAQQLALGVTTEFSFASDPDAPRRNNYSIYAAYSANLSRSFFVSASALLAVRDYYVGDRTDVNEILGLSANYRVRDWLTLSFLSSFAWNQSNQNVFDYSVANVGGGVGVTFRF